MNRQQRTLQPAITPNASGTWVQTDREGHLQMAKLAARNPRALAVLHILVANMQTQNALVASQTTLAEVAGCTLRTIQRAIATLKKFHFIDTRQIGASGTVNAYIINDRIAWVGKRDAIRHSLFSADVLVSTTEQPDAETLDQLPPLIPIPDFSRIRPWTDADREEYERATGVTLTGSTKKDPT